MSGSHATPSRNLRPHPDAPLRRAHRPLPDHRYPSPRSGNLDDFFPFWRRQIPHIRQLIQADNSTFQMRFQHMKNKIQANKPSSAGYDDSHIPFTPSLAYIRTILQCCLSPFLCDFLKFQTPATLYPQTHPSLRNIASHYPD